MTSNTCHICGETNRTVLHRHHIIPRRFEGPDQDENLVTLCANCHEAIEKIYTDEIFQRFARKLTPDTGSFEEVDDTVKTFIKEETERVDERHKLIETDELYQHYESFCERRSLPVHQKYEFIRVVEENFETEYVEFMGDTDTDSAFVKMECELGESLV